MTLMLELPSDLAQVLTDEAARSGQEAAEFARALLVERLQPAAQMERNRRAVALLDHWDYEDETSGDDEGELPVIPPLSLREVSVD